MRDRYTDWDVHRDPSLTLEALNYLRNYRGGFEFLVSCRFQVEQGKALTAAQVRGVLNCMRVDPEVDEPEPQPIQEWVEEQERLRQEALRRRRKRVLRTRVTIKAPFGMANNGKVLHRPRPNGSCTWRHPFHGDPPKTGYAEDRTLNVRWACGVTPVVPILMDKRPIDVNYCRSGCFSVDCTTCGAQRQHLSPDQPPNDKITCAVCGAKNSQETP